MTLWRPITDGNFVGGEMEIQLGPHGHQYRGLVSAFEPSPISNQAYFRFEWMAALKFPDMPWRKLPPEIDTNLALMLTTDPEARHAGAYSFNAIAIEAGLSAILPPNPLLCVMYPHGGSAIKQFDSELYDPREANSV